MTLGTDHAEDSLVEQVLAQSRIRPTATALVLPGGGAITYRVLVERAAALAARLGAVGVRRRQHVAVVAGADQCAVLGMMAVALLGGVCVPIDRAQPPARLRRMFEIVDAKAVVTNEQAVCDLADALDLPSLGTDDAIGEQALSAGQGLAGNSTAYVIFTSGSTGDPKAVVVGHHALRVHVTRVRELYGVDDAAVCLQFTSPGFDVAQEEIWCALTAGARLVLRGDRMWPLAELVELCDLHGVTHLQLPTAYWAHLVSEARDQQHCRPPGSVRLLVIGSEAADIDTVHDYLRGPLGAVRLINAYGPTEAVVTATAWDSARGDDLGTGPYLSIGLPLPGRGADVLGPDLRVAPAGAVGELYLSGECLAEGYLNAPSGDVFVTLPDGRRAIRTGDLVRRDTNGLLHYVGRTDDQVQIAGTRIELAEVELALRSHDGVAAAAVTVGGHAQTAHLVAHVVTRRTEHGDLSADELRQHLRGLLPPSMVPSRIRFAHRLPLTVNGKIDRSALACE